MFPRQSGAISWRSGDGIGRAAEGVTAGFAISSDDARPVVVAVRSGVCAARHRVTTKVPTVTGATPHKRRRADVQCTFARPLCGRRATVFGSNGCICHGGHPCVMASRSSTTIRPIRCESPTMLPVRLADSTTLDAWHMGWSSGIGSSRSTSSRS